MGATGLRPDGGIGVRFSVASRTRGAEFGVAPKGLSGGTPPHRLRRQFGDATSEIGKADLIREGGGQRDPDAGDHCGFLILGARRNIPSAVWIREIPVHAHHRRKSDVRLTLAEVP